MNTLGINKGKLLRNKKEQNTNTHNVDEYAEQKKSDTSAHTVR